MPVSSSLPRTVAAAVGQAALTSASRLVVGLSGGVDSLALTYLLLQLERSGDGPAVFPVHVDHRLRPDSAVAARQVASLGRRVGREVEVVVADVAAWDRVLHQGIESAARAARYAALAAAARKLDTTWVAVGHNADDQAESVLMALLRGGTSGAIGGMRQSVEREVPLDPDRTEWEKVSLLRPLLTTRRSEIEAFIRSIGVEPIEDPSNRSFRFQRNVIRHRLMPAVEAAVPGAASAIARSASLLRSDDDYLEVLASDVMDAVVEVVEGDVQLIIRDRFQELPEPIQRRVLWRALERLNPTRRRIKGERVEAACVAIATQGEGATIEVVDDVLVYLDYETAAIGSRETLLPGLLRRSDLPRSHPWVVFNLPKGDSVHQLAEGWVLSMNLCLALDELGEIPKLRTRRAGDRLTFGSRASLQDFMVNRKVPRYMRDRLPLVAVGSSVLWIGGLSPSRFSSKDGALTLGLERQVPRETVGDKRL